MDVSVVIPARNEAPWLERLLRVLLKWDPTMEIVIADHESTDDTRAIATAYGCRMVRGGRPGPGRNRGAGAASGRYLLFIDADVVPTAEALNAVRGEVERPRSDVVGFRHIPVSDDRLIRCFYRIADIWFALTSRTRSKQALASFLLVRRQCFEAIGGFDSSLDPGEDVDFVRRAGRVSNVRYVRKAPVLVSPRRFSTEARSWFAMKTTIWGLMRSFGIRATVMRYRWSAHDPACADTEARLLPTMLSTPSIGPKTHVD